MRDISNSLFSVESMQILDAVGIVLQKRFSEYESTMKSVRDDVETMMADLRSSHEKIARLQNENDALKKAFESHAHDVDLSGCATTEQLREMYFDLSVISERIDAKNKNHPEYSDGEVVRAGEFRRFGIGGVYEAMRDTAKSVFEKPDDWLMISDGLVFSETDVGFEVKSISSDFRAVLKHGERGDEGQRGKKGDAGLRGNDGVGVDAVEVTENGIAVVLTTGKTFAFDFTAPLERAVRDVAPVIEQIVVETIGKSAQ